MTPRCARITSAASTAGFTLIELTVTLALSAVLMVSLGSAIMIATRSIPDGHAPPGQVVAAARGLDMLCAELYYAQSFTSLGSNSITFTVAPRGADTSPETIAYSWSGVPGDPLLRRYNNNPAMAVVASINSFGLTYSKRSVVSTNQVTTTSTTPEQLLASFTNWSGLVLLPGYNDFAASSVNRISEYFTITATPPSGATAMNITRVSLNLKSYPGGGSLFRVGLYKPSAPQPTANALVGPVNVSTSSLTASYGWFDVYFASTPITNLSQDFCVVVFAPTGTPAVYAQYMSSLLAPADTDTMQTSSDSGNTWGPTLLSNQQDMPFYCYGTWTTSTTTTQTVTDYYLQSAGITLQTSADAAAPINTAVEIYAQPKVTGL